MKKMLITLTSAFALMAFPSLSFAKVPSGITPSLGDIGGQTLDPVLNMVYDTWYYNVEPKYDSSYKTRFKPFKFETIGNVGKTDPTTGKVLPKYAYEIFEADKSFCLPYYSECVGTLKSGNAYSVTYSSSSTITYQESVEAALSTVIKNSSQLGLKIDILNFGYSINREVKSTVSTALSITETKTSSSTVSYNYNISKDGIYHFQQRGLFKLYETLSYEIIYDETNIYNNAKYKLISMNSDYKLVDDLGQALAKYHYDDYGNAIYDDYIENSSYIYF